MELMRGQGRRGMMKKFARELLPIGEVLRMLTQVCDALVYTHECGVIHCDIKPENIMLLENGNIKLLDFGIALIEGERQVGWRGFSSPIGTPDYMAPERLLGQRGDARADIYAVGGGFYELLCGRTPFEETNGFAIITRHISHYPPGILQFNPALSPVLATVVMRAIRRDPERRYACMQDMLYDLGYLDTVTPMDYIPDPPKLGGRYRQAIRIALIVLIVCLFIVAFGLLAQFAHHLAR